MSLAAVVLLGIALGTDAFSACIGVGFGGIGRRRGVILVLTVTVLHVLMPLAGLWLGGVVGSALGRVASMIGAGLLFLLGARMIYGAVRASVTGTACALPVGKWGTLFLGASVSMDAFSVGFALGVYQYSPLLVTGTFGLVAGIMAALGLGLGRAVSRWTGQRAQVLGGLILLGVGVQLLR